MTDSDAMTALFFLPTSENQAPSDTNHVSALFFGQLFEEKRTYVFVTFCMVQLKSFRNWMDGGYQDEE